MKNVFFYLSIVLISLGCQTKKTIISAKPFNVQRSINTILENQKAYVLIATNNDIIEVFKPPFNKTTKCKNIVLGKEYSFKVFPVSDLLQSGIETPKEYFLNDSTMIKYNSYYSLEKFQILCK
ncbi:hypothetical protein [Chryseobacterium sp. NKUCC03_KSP]|uniref:hypothetical protein n=1 Tax=Chryseobacterium sp. NKUCC03_KSP TaxID=2842125 RepID=UPI001C5B4818|nr:hypothetical protein [Chryseobacterium sp. NKUCC03_KSP]MBW3524901.1 hypothetical protein [Chryseobacterium sp. NKUCC03_KSP]